MLRNHAGQQQNLTATGGSLSIFGRSKIQGAFQFFDGHAWYTVSIDHRSPDVAVAEKCLNSADVVVGLKQVSGERVAKGMGRDTLGEPGPTHRKMAAA